MTITRPASGRSRPLPSDAAIQSRQTAASGRGDAIGEVTPTPHRARDAGGSVATMATLTSSTRSTVEGWRRDQSKREQRVAGDRRRPHRTTCRPRSSGSFVPPS
jgi:hypothetical protein